MSPFFYSPVTVAIVAILVGCIVAVTRTLAATRVRELEIRERIAMIERGLVPPPESDPKGFERAMNRIEHPQFNAAPAQGGRQRRVAVILIGLGLGLMVLIAAAGDDPRNAIGVGGFIAILGLAFFVSSLLEPPRRERVSEPSPLLTPGPPAAQPPANASAADLH